jgi:hypothetical protein
MYKIIASIIAIPVIVMSAVACGSDSSQPAANEQVVEASYAQPTTTTTTTTIPEVVVETTLPPEPEPVIEAPVAQYSEPVYVEPSYSEPAYVEPEVYYEVSSGSVEDLICQSFGDQCQKALAVAWCESNHNPGVVGGAGERGLFQIHPVHIPNLGPYGGWDAMFNPSANIAYAYALYSSSGWGPWTCA